MNVLTNIAAMSDLSEGLTKSIGDLRWIEDTRDYVGTIERFKPAGEHFRLDLITRGPGEFFAIVGEDFNGVTGKIAARIDRLGSWSLARYWQEVMPRFYTGRDAACAQPSPDQCPLAHTIHGDVAYLGDLWVREDKRRKGAASMLVRLAQMVCVAQWQVEFIYGFMTDDHVRRGLAAQYHWTVTIPNALRWDVPAQEIPTDLWLTGAFRQDVEYLQSLAVECQRPALASMQAAAE